MAITASYTGYAIALQDAEVFKYVIKFWKIIHIWAHMK